MEVPNIGSAHDSSSASGSTMGRRSSWHIPANHPIPVDRQPNHGESQATKTNMPNRHPGGQQSSSRRSRWERSQHRQSSNQSLGEGETYASASMATAITPLEVAINQNIIARNTDSGSSASYAQSSGAIPVESVTNGRSRWADGGSRARPIIFSQHCHAPEMHEETQGESRATLPLSANGTQNNTRQSADNQLGEFGDVSQMTSMVNVAHMPPLISNETDGQAGFLPVWLRNNLNQDRNASSPHQAQGLLNESYSQNVEGAAWQVRLQQPPARRSTSATSAGDANGRAEYDGVRVHTTRAQSEHASSSGFQGSLGETLIPRHPARRTVTATEDMFNSVSNSLHQHPDSLQSNISQEAVSNAEALHMADSGFSASLEDTLAAPANISSHISAPQQTRSSNAGVGTLDGVPHGAVPATATISSRHASQSNFAADLGEVLSNARPRRGPTSSRRESQSLQPAERAHTGNANAQTLAETLHTADSQFGLSLEESLVAGAAASRSRRSPDAHQEANWNMSGPDESNGRQRATTSESNAGWTGGLGDVLRPSANAAQRRREWLEQRQQAQPAQTALADSTPQTFQGREERRNTSVTGEGQPSLQEVLSTSRRMRSRANIGADVDSATVEAPRSSHRTRNSNRAQETHWASLEDTFGGGRRLEQQRRNEQARQHFSSNQPPASVQQTNADGPSSSFNSFSGGLGEVLAEGAARRRRRNRVSEANERGTVWESARPSGAQNQTHVSRRADRNAPAVGAERQTASGLSEDDWLLPAAADALFNSSEPSNAAHAAGSGDFWPSGMPMTYDALLALDRAKPSKGVPKSKLARLKKRRAKESDKAKECAVCLDEFGANVWLRQLPCEHVFHDQCISKWLEAHTQCPMCRYDCLENKPAAS